MRSNVAPATLASVRTEGFFDQIARTLAEPIPRRRAVRVIGASIAALAVPGVSPRVALGAASTASQFACGTPGQPVCSFTNPDRSPGPDYCCPYPPQQWQCSSNSTVKKCTNTCPARVHNPILGRTLNQKSTWSTETDAGGRPLRYRCCVVPDTIAKDGECLPNCRLDYLKGLAKGPVSCGKVCCASHEVCVSGKCEPCEKFGGHSCQPAKKGATICCAKGTTCCFNDTSTACCGPRQTCRASNRGKPAKCSCKKGEARCGSDCCNSKRGETCCDGLAGSSCCQKGETCCSGECCGGKAVCCDEGCCDPAKGDFCLAKLRPQSVGGGIGLTCKRGCAPSNRCGAYCCGTGTRCVNGKCVK